MTATTLPCMSNMYILKTTSLSDPGISRVLAALGSAYLPWEKRGCPRRTAVTNTSHWHALQNTSAKECRTRADSFLIPLQTLCRESQKQLGGILKSTLISSNYAKKQASSIGEFILVWPDWTYRLGRDKDILISDQLVNMYVLFKAYLVPVLLKGE